MKKKLLAAAILALAPLTAASAMNVSEFVKRADALEKKGMMALFSRGEINALKAEVQSAAKQLRAERVAEEKAGKPKAFCPPAEAQLNSKELLGHFRAIPPPQQARLTVKDGLRSLFAKKYPCR